MTAFGDKLKKIRTERNMSQEEMGELLGTSKQVISRYETNQRTPKITIVEEYAKKLNVPLDYLINNSISTLQEVTDKDFSFLTSQDASVQTPRDERDLAKFLDKSDIMFDGTPLTEEDKDKVRKALEIVFWDAKAKNKEAYAKARSRKKD